MRREFFWSTIAVIYVYARGVVLRLGGAWQSHSHFLLTITVYIYTSYNWDGTNGYVVLRSGGRARGEGMEGGRGGRKEE